MYKRQAVCIVITKMTNGGFGKSKLPLCSEYIEYYNEMSFVPCSLFVPTKPNKQGGCLMNWEPWTGCYKASDGCTNRYFYGPYAKHYGQNTIQKTDKFDWPIRKNAKGDYNIKGNKILATCFATDFFLPEADEWHKEIWAIIKERKDIEFLDVYKRQVYT